MYNQYKYLASVVGTFFRLIPNFFLLFCSDLAAFICPTLLADIPKPNRKSAKDLPPETPLVFYFILYSTFTFCIKPHSNPIIDNIQDWNHNS